MAVNSIKIFDDTVIKMTVNQGLEEQRIVETLGSFSTGELAYTRDTGRLFVGDNSDGKEGHKGVQETVGGSLVGNKYLGMIDSKPLVTFYHNGIPLSYEVTTNINGTQEREEIYEEGLFTAKSKFRLHSEEDADQVWDNWSRAAVYNPKYNAYNGDFMYDRYRNAWILFDTNISGDPESDTQPQIKTGEDGLPVEPETFIVDGEEIQSTSKEAVGLTRRTKLQNYSKINDENTADNLVYGDGYVIFRNIEPDNQTVRFKPRSFQLNGEPEGINNFSHNILEVFYVPTEAIAGNFTDDFVIDGLTIALNKGISDVVSITGANNTIKFPGDIQFANRTGNGHTAQTYMRWHINEPTNITLPTDDTFKVVFTPTTTETDDGKSYISFEANLVAEDKLKPPFYFKLDGAYSDQEDPSRVVLDERAMSVETAPTITIDIPEDEAILEGLEEDPYSVGESGDIVYSGNIGFDKTGKAEYFDEFAPEYYNAVAPMVDKWEEQNTSINFLKTPVTIIQSSTANNLYHAIPSFTTNPIVFESSLAGIISEASIDSSVMNLLQLATTPDTLQFAYNIAPEEMTDPLSVNWIDNKVTLPSSTDQNGCGFVVTSHIIEANTDIGTILVSGKTENVHSGADKKLTLFCAIINATDTGINIVKLHTIKQYYANFNFTFAMDAVSLILDGINYVAVGYLGEGTGSLDITFDTVLAESRVLDSEQIFQTITAGANINLDFCVSPYLYCMRKVVSAPYAGILPEVTETSNYPTLSADYFTDFNETNVKTWNDLLSVLGHNHYADLTSTETTTPIIGLNGQSSVKKGVFITGMYYANEDGTAVVPQVEITADFDPGSALFSWYKEYSTDESGAETEVTYYPADDYEQRSENTLNDNGYEITSVKIEGNDTELIDGSAEGIIKGTEEYSPRGENRKRVQFAICCDSVLHKSIETYVKYVAAGTEYVYDFVKHGIVAYSYNMDVDQIPHKMVCIPADGSEAITVTEGLDIIFSSNLVNADTELVAGKTIKDFKYIILELERGAEDMDDPDMGEDQSPYFYEIFGGAEASYLVGSVDPGKLTETKIYTNGELLESVTVDETVDEEDKIYVPSTARTIILEVEHVTTQNNSISIMYSNNFDDLGILIPGLPVEEFPSPKYIVHDLVLNPAHQPELAEKSYQEAEGVYKLKLGKSTPVAEPDTRAYHDLGKTIEENQKLLPSVFAPTAKEKVMMNSANTETRVIEIPLHKLANTEMRHFALRLANIRPSNENILNSLSVRVIGYRV